MRARLVALSAALAVLLGGSAVAFAAALESNECSVATEAYAKPSLKK
jgi:hypothetical protein